MLEVRSNSKCDSFKAILVARDSDHKLRGEQSFATLSHSSYLTKGAPRPVCGEGLRKRGNVKDESSSICKYTPLLAPSYVTLDLLPSLPVLHISLIHNPYSSVQACSPIVSSVTLAEGACGSQAWEVHDVLSPGLGQRCQHSQRARNLYLIDQ